MPTGDALHRKCQQHTQSLSEHDAPRVFCRFLGSVRISTSGKQSAMRADTSAVGFERRQLALLLQQQASQKHPHTITFKFGHSCVGADLEGGTVSFRRGGKGAELTTLPFDLLVGADGQNSRVRELLEDQVHHV